MNDQVFAGIFSRKVICACEQLIKRGYKFGAEDTNALEHGAAVYKFKKPEGDRKLYISPLYLLVEGRINNKNLFLDLSRKLGSNYEYYAAFYDGTSGYKSNPYNTYILAYADLGKFCALKYGGYDTYPNFNNLKKYFPEIKWNV